MKSFRFIPRLAVLPLSLALSSCATGGPLWVTNLSESGILLASTDTGRTAALAPQERRTVSHREGELLVREEGSGRVRAFAISIDDQPHETEVRGGSLVTGVFDGGGVESVYLDGELRVVPPEWVAAQRREAKEERKALEAEEVAPPSVERREAQMVNRGEANAPEETVAESDEEERKSWFRMPTMKVPEIKKPDWGKLKLPSFELSNPFEKERDAEGESDLEYPVPLEAASEPASEATGASPDPSGEPAPEEQPRSKNRRPFSWLQRDGDG